jgi:hypothetical protein
LISAPDATRLVAAVSAGTAFAFLTLIFRPLKEDADGAVGLSKLHLPPGALLQALVIGLCIITIAVLRKFPRRLYNSLVLGLMNSVD